MIVKTCNNPTYSPDPSCPQCNAWALDLLQEWKAVATSNSIIYTYGYVSSASFPDNKKETHHTTTNTSTINVTSIASNILLGVLTIVSLVIQIVVPIAIIVTLPAPDGFCPNQAQPMTKIIGFTLCIYFVALTISMCLNKLRGLGFLKLFCSHDDLGSKWKRFFLDIGILANMISMAAAGIAQYLLFIRNAEKDYVLLVLQSLAMQFFLTVDEKLMTTAWTSWTKRQLVNLVNREEEQTNNPGADADADTDADVERDQSNVHMDENTLKKVRLMYFAEATFLGFVCIVGIAWSIGLAYCM